MLNTITSVSSQWMSRPEDERFVNLTQMRDHFEQVRAESRAAVLPTRRLMAQPDVDNKGLQVVADGSIVSPTHWAFGQLAQRAEAPAGYLRTLHPAIAADCINYGLQIKRNIEDVGVLVQENGSKTLRAATGPNYGRIWNADILDEVIKRFGDGTGEWRVPGEFGKRLDVKDVTKKNTTLFAGDRDMFIFLADDSNRIEIANRRDGQAGQFSRGFLAWNSEVGSATLGIAAFLYDYMCCNRIIWGVSEYKEIRVRHTASAPDKFVEEVTPVIEAYGRSSGDRIIKVIEAAQKQKLDDKVDSFIANRFGKNLVLPFQQVFKAEEGRPIETAFDVTTAATAYARGVKWQDTRVEIERKAGKILELAE
jgi:hypothetical protein